MPIPHTPDAAAMATGATPPPSHPIEFITPTAVGVMNSIGWLGGGVAPVAMAAASGVWGMGMCLSATSAVYAVAGVLLVTGASRWMRKAVSPAAQPPAN